MNADPSSSQEKFTSDVFSKLELGSLTFVEPDEPSGRFARLTHFVDFLRDAGLIGAQSEDAARGFEDWRSRSAADALYTTREKCSAATRV